MREYPNAVAALKLYANLMDTIVQDKLKARDALEKCSKLAPGDVEVNGQLQEIISSLSLSRTPGDQSPGYLAN